MNAIEYHQKIVEALRSADPEQMRAALQAVIQSHEPVPCAPGSMIMDCRGCDAGTHAEWLAEAPCTTLDIVAQRLGVKR